SRCWCATAARTACTAPRSGLASTSSTPSSAPISACTTSRRTGPGKPARGGPDRARSKGALPWADLNHRDLSPERAPMNSPLVSAIIPTFNCARYVTQAVESALRQTYRPLEVVVVDDGSTDETPRVLASYQSQIRYLRQPNRGLSAARNRGIAEATGGFVAF